MNSFHPFLSSFPVALIVVAALLEFWSQINKKSNYNSVITVNLIIGSAFAVLAFVTGYQAKEIASQTFAVAEDSILLHHYWGRALLFVLVPCLVFNFFTHRNTSPVAKALYLLTLLVATAIVVYTGYLGGQLVFMEGAGVVAKVLP